MTGDHILAVAAILATVAALAVLRARTAPKPAYDYPVWAWRIAVAIRAWLSPRRRHLAATRRNGTMLTRPPTQAPTIPAAPIRSSAPARIPHARQPHHRPRPVRADHES